MYIFSIEFDGWSTILLRLNWFALLIFASLAGLALFAFRYRKQQLNKRVITVDESNLGIGSNTMQITCTKRDRDIAYDLWVELSTRQIGDRFDADTDVLTDVFESWSEFASVARTTMSSIAALKASSSSQLIIMTEQMLNKSLRPQLAKWQTKYNKWYQDAAAENKAMTPQELQKTYPEYDQLLSDVVKTNQHMINFKDLMKQISFEQK